VAVDPERLDGIGEPLQVAPGGAADLYPVVVRVEQPVLLLIAFRSGIEERYIHDVEHTRVAPVLVLTLVLRNLLVFPGAHWSNPPDRLVS